MRVSISTFFCMNHKLNWYELLSVFPFPFIKINSKGLKPAGPGYFFGDKIGRR